MIKEDELENDKWYVAYAHHHWASVKDIDTSKSFYSYEEAKQYASELLCDDDNVEIYLWFYGHWYYFELIRSDMPCCENCSYIFAAAEHLEDESDNDSTMKGIKQNEEH